MPKEFKLSDYTSHIVDIAHEYNVPVDKALTMFIKNLATMKEYYKGASGVDYGSVGQMWNKLSSDSRITQRRSLQSDLQKYYKGGTKS